jgi:hypothetical protein
MKLSRNDLPTGFVPNCNRIDWTHVARAQQPFTVYLFRAHEYRCPGVVQDESLRSFRDAVSESYAQGPVNADAEAADDALFEIAHIPSRPSSARAVSITAGVISAMPRSLA